MAHRSAVLFGAALLLAGTSAVSFVGQTAPLGALRGQIDAQRVGALSAKPDGIAEEAAAGVAVPAEASRLTGAAFSLLAALLVALAPATEAWAARSGGRIGGTAPAARKAPPSARTAPKVINKTTVVEKNTTVVMPPPVAPPVVAAPPMGMGYGMGMAPVMVAPGPSVGDMIVGTVVGNAISSAITPHHSGPSANDRILENQQRQDERQMDKQAMQIEELQRELRDLKK